MGHNEMLAQKYGKDIAWAEKMNQNLTQMARQAGLEFHMDLVIPANSFNAHRLIHLAKTYDKQDLMKEKLLSAKFIEGLDIDDPSVLTKLGLNLGLDEKEITTFLESDQFEADVRRDEERAGTLGISGVPFFLFNKIYALSGAQPVEAFLEILKKFSEG